MRWRDKAEVVVVVVVAPRHGAVVACRMPELVVGDGRRGGPAGAVRCGLRRKASVVLVAKHTKESRAGTGCSNRIVYTGVVVAGAIDRMRWFL